MGHPPGPTGWVDDPRAVERFVATLERPLFGLAAPHLKGTGRGKDVLFWMAEEKILGKVLPAHRQTIGDCVSHGWGRGVQDLKLIEIAIKGEREQWQGEIATEPIYAGSRVEIGGGRLSGDGSIGAWAAGWVKQYGVLLRSKYDEFDLTRYSGRKARQWGRRGAGVPDALEPIAREHPVRTVSLVTDADEGRDALVNGFPIPICSNQGFTTQRDRQGFCRPRGSWAHCMEARGYCTVKGNRPAVAIQQSWGESPTGPNRLTLESGREIALPQGVFLIDMEVFDRMLKQKDSFAISNFEGFPAQDLDWVMI